MWNPNGQDTEMNAVYFLSTPSTPRPAEIVYPKSRLDKINLKY